MYKHFLAAILLVLFMNLPVRAAEVASGQYSVKAAVKTSSIYAWTVQRQSAVDIPKSGRSGDRVSLQGVLKRQNSIPLKKQSVSLMIGQGDQTVFAAAAVTSDLGEYVFDLKIDEAWWGDYWISVGVMTYGRPIWLVLQQALTIDPQVVMGVVETRHVWRVDGVLESTGRELSEGDISDRAGDTMYLLTANNLFDKARDVSTDTQVGARGRDSPVFDRSIGDAGRGPKRTGGGRHQQADQLPRQGCQF